MTSAHKTLLALEVSFLGMRTKSDLVIVQAQYSANGRFRWMKKNFIRAEAFIKFRVAVIAWGCVAVEMSPGVIDLIVGIFSISQSLG